MFEGPEPPLELRRCPWTRHDSPDRAPAKFEQWLRDRQAWRETNAQPLPDLFARDRVALHLMAEAGQLDPEIVRAEESAPKAEPEWVARAKAPGSYPGFTPKQADLIDTSVKTALAAEQQGDR